MPKNDISSFARLDFARKARTGFGETVFGQGKTPEQLAKIFAAFKTARQPVLATRCTAEQAAYLAEAGIACEWDPVSRTIVSKGRHNHTIDGLVAVCTGGTADIPIAEEAAKTVEFFGGKALRLFDVGIAGLHRLLGKIDKIRKADVVIAVAGMEGALGSVIAGLVAAPVVAVPTSVGYGAGAGGIAPLLAMLNSCAEGLSVVNIDNGFGAAICACRMIKRLKG
jgi:NCAIR mutase (PurE)-related protein